MKNIAIILLSLVFLPQTGLANENTKECQLSFVTQKQLKRHHELEQRVDALGREIAKAMKTSFEFASLIDKYTLGLVSALLNIDGHTVSELTPTQFNKLKLKGVLLYKDSPLSVTPLRGTKLSIYYEDKAVEMYTGAQGEFNQFFYKIVPYMSFRLFPAPMLSVQGKFVSTAKVPLTLELDSPFCKASMKVSEIPFEPIILFAGTPE